MKRKPISPIRWVVKQRQWYIPHEPLVAKALGISGYFGDIFAAQVAADRLEARGYAATMIV